VVAVDTNVLVRLLTRDEPEQASRAAALFRSEGIWIGKTVPLETDWVLRSLYEFTAQQVAQALRALAGLPNVRLEDAVAAAQALEWQQRGLDFADALHLASKGKAASFASFDTKFVRSARRAGAGDVRLL
jgi:predicted nucleic-acid-binding protein